MFIVKKYQLFEGVNPSFGILAEDLKGAQNAHGANKTDFLRNHHIENQQDRGPVVDQYHEVT